MNRENGLMTSGDYRKKIILFAIPLFIGNLFQQMYNTADSLIVGRFVSDQGLAAITSTGSLVYIIVEFFMGFSIGAGIIIARRIGAEDHDRTVRAVHTTVSMGLFFGVVMSLFGVFCSNTLLRWMGTPEDVFSDASTYLRIYFAGAFFLVMYNTFVGILQASGDSRHPLYYLVISSLLNIVLDLYFIIVLHMGVAGAATATIISEGVSALLAGMRLMKAEGDIRLDWRKLTVSLEDLSQIVRFGVPTALQSCVIDLSNIFIQSYINSFGSAAMAGVGASIKIEGFSFLPVTAFSMALSTYVSQNLGAGLNERAEKGVRFGTLTAVTMSETIGIVFFFTAPLLISLFSSDPAVIAIGTARMKVCTLFYCFVSFSHVISAVIRGEGRPAVPMMVMLVCWCAVRVLAIFTIGRITRSIQLIYWIYPFTWSLSTIAFLVYRRSLKRI